MSISPSTCCLFNIFGTIIVLIYIITINVFLTIPMFYHWSNIIIVTPTKIDVIVSIDSIMNIKNTTIFLLDIPITNDNSLLQIYKNNEICSNIALSVDYCNGTRINLTSTTLYYNQYKIDYNVPFDKDVIQSINSSCYVFDTISKEFGERDRVFSKEFLNPGFLFFGVNFLGSLGLIFFVLFGCLRENDYSKFWGFWFILVFVYSFFILFFPICYNPLYVQGSNCSY